MSTVQLSESRTTGIDTELVARAGCLLAALGTVPMFAIASIRGDSGAEITAGLLEDATVLTVVSIAGPLVAALLLLSAVRLGRRVRGAAGGVVLAAGASVAVLFGAYYAAFGAGAVVADQMLLEPGPGLGEATALMLNLVELTRYAPGLALVAAAFVARRQLPGWVGVSAVVLLVMTFVPFTTWVAALLIPVWLGAAGALRSPAHE